MIHPATDVRQVSETIGAGAFATAKIPKGTVLWVLDRLDRRVQPGQVDTLPAALARVVERYSYQDAGGDLIFCWDAGRMMNHSCDPATVAVTRTLEVARRDIEPGDALTCDYGVLNMTGTLDCHCGAPVCRRQVRSDEASAHLAQWDAWAADAWTAAYQVPQPLLPFADPPEGDRVWIDALRDGRLIPPPSLAYLLRPPVQGRAADPTRLWATR